MIRKFCTEKLYIKIFETCKYPYYLYIVYFKFYVYECCHVKRINNESLYCNLTV